ncbi:polymer-forming cytoskeletal protein [Bacteroidales bacterium OttesenSCG-928-C03]|nr:polymer-forming cytoskeletal protein [Bacteroidales bacterium OttesenSCG-928-C03]MDL2325928.1 polymer-forming cytoskeletal protein [Bacteroidales bacterium OttesenSCG-928-A14]
MAKVYDQEVAGGVNIIASGTTFVGDIITSGDCRIDGTIKGNIKSKAKVIIGQSGNIEGEITCQSIDIEGCAKANVNAIELLSLKATAVLTGNITVGKISIEPGANFMGNCKMQNSKIEIPVTHEPKLGQ